MNPKTKRKVEIISLLAGIWFVVTLPLPWIIADPNVAKPQLTVILQMIAFISIPVSYTHLTLPTILRV